MNEQETDSGNNNITVSVLVKGGSVEEIGEFDGKKSILIGGSAEDIRNLYDQLGSALKQVDPKPSTGSDHVRAGTIDWAAVRDTIHTTRADHMDIADIENTLRRPMRASTDEHYAMRYNIDDMSVDANDGLPHWATVNGIPIPRGLISSGPRDLPGFASVHIDDDGGLRITNINDTLTDDEARDIAGVDENGNRTNRFDEPELHDVMPAGSSITYLHDDETDQPLYAMREISASGPAMVIVDTTNDDGSVDSHTFTLPPNCTDHRVTWGGESGGTPAGLLATLRGGATITLQSDREADND